MRAQKAMDRREDKVSGRTEGATERDEGGRGARTGLDRDEHLTP